MYWMGSTLFESDLCAGDWGVGVARLAVLAIAEVPALAQGSTDRPIGISGARRDANLTLSKPPPPPHTRP